MENHANHDTRLQDWLNIDRARLLGQDISSTIKRKSEHIPSVSSVNLPSVSSVNHQNQLDNNNKVPKEELIKYMSNLPGYLEKGDDEKALSFGVLDWRRLEKWQHNHRQTYCPSSSNDTSYFSTDRISSRSSRGQSCSTDEAEKEVDVFQDLKEKSDKPAKMEYSLYSKYQSFSRLQEMKLKERENDDIEVHSIRKMKTQNGKSTRQVEESENLGSRNSRNYHESGKNKAPSDFQSKHLGGIKQPTSNRKLSSESFEYPSHSSKLLISPSKGKNVEDRTTKAVDRSESKIGIMGNHKLRNTSSNHMLSFGMNRFSKRSSSLDLCSEPVESKTQSKQGVNHSSLEIPQLRNPSPTRKLSIGLNRFSRRSSSLDFPNVLQSSSEHDPYIFQSKKDVDFCLENSSKDELHGGRKSQMNPLRRLFDPLLKPKAVNSHHFAHSSEKDLENMHSQRHEPIDGKQKPSTVQALIQFSIKNGLPLFTFADDKNSSILAATVKKVSAIKKRESCWVYTFFSVDEVKKKSSWTNKGHKSETHSYIPSVIAQMRVSDIRHNPANKFSTREFISFSVDVSENDEETSNFWPNDELAAILVKFAKDTPSHRNEFRKGNDNVTDPVFSVTAILPDGSHGLPIEGKPSPLIERWKSGGLCDCGGWDLGCRLKVLTSQAESDRRSKFSETFLDSERFELFPQGEAADNRPVFILSPFKDNVYSVEFDSSLSFLQAFSTCISILNCRKPYDLSELSKLFEFEAEMENRLVADEETKAPNPPFSSVDRV